MAAWAKFPTRWAIGSEKLSLPGQLNLMTYNGQEDKKTSWAALRILIGLSVMLNQANRHAAANEAFAKKAAVKATWDDLQELAPVARKTIGRALDRLEALGAIHRELVGRANLYHLHGLEEMGGWCQLPQDHLAFGGRMIGLLDGLVANRMGLASLKLYVLLLAFRDWKKNSTVISYTRMSERSGVARADIRQALTVLTTCDLIRQVGPDEDVQDDHRFNVYQVRGLRQVLQSASVEGGN